MTNADPKAVEPETAPSCPLCTCGTTARFHCDRIRSYWRCTQCRLVFVSPQDLPDPATEKAEYDLHRNEAGEPGYRRFLSQLAEPMLERLSPDRQGLDFGCGPGPELATMFEEAGHHVALYDPFYADHPDVLERQYDFVCATEVVEHFHDPARDFATLFSMLRPGGWLGLMTWLLTTEREFGRWSYIRDQTHVGFYSRSTFEFIARQFGAKLYILSERVLLLRVPSDDSSQSQAG